MSTTIKSKKKPQTVSPVARYKLKQKLFFITRYKDVPENIIECEVRAVKQTDTDNSPFDKVTTFSYLISGKGHYQDKIEAELYPSFAEAAKVFATPYLTLIK